MNILFLGPPGAGKGTQAQLVCKKLGIPQVSTGDMLRTAIAAKTDTGLKVKALVDAGQLVPDDVMIAIVKERLAMDDCKNGYILDGFPRTVEQAIALSDFVKIDAAINLDVSDAVLINRLSGRRVCSLCGAPYHVSSLGNETSCKLDGTLLIQRDDDKAETVLSRLQIYHHKTAPLIDFYTEKGLLINVGGHLAMEEICNEIIRALEAIR